MAAKTHRLNIFTDTDDQSPTGQEYDNVGSEQSTIWAELLDRETVRESHDRKEVVKDEVRYRIGEHVSVNADNFFERTKANATTYRVKSISFDDEGPTGNRIMVGVATK